MADDPAGVTDRMTRGLRAGKVFVDWSQNDPGKSTVAAYSVRGLRVPTVAAPLTWNEVESAVVGGDPGALVHGIQGALERIAAHGDLFGPVLEAAQRLPAELPVRE